MKRIIFLHGFKSTPIYSRKINILKKYYPKHYFITPQINIEPKKAIKQIDQLIKQDGNDQILNTILVGSSLGGFYAYYNSIKWKIFCLLINPSLTPSDTLKEFVGKQRIFITGNIFEWKNEYLEQLKQLENEIYELDKNPSYYRVILGKFDERLDPEKSIKEFKKSVVRIYETNHRFEKLEEALKDKKIKDIF